MSEIRVYSALQHEKLNQFIHTAHTAEAIDHHLREGLPRTSNGFDEAHLRATELVRDGIYSEYLEGDDALKAIADLYIDDIRAKYEREDAVELENVRALLKDMG